MDIEELSNKIDKYHEEDIKRADRDKKENLGYISFGFALAATGLAVTNPDCTDRLITSLAAVVLLIIGIVLFRKSRKSES